MPLVLSYLLTKCRGETVAKGKGSSGQHELYIHHDHDGSAGVSTTRVFFTTAIDSGTLDWVIRPGIVDGVETKNLIGSVDGYQHYIAIRWLHVDYVLGNKTLEQLKEEISRTADRVLTNAFDWESSVIKVLNSNTEVQRKSAELGVDWARGRRPL